MGVILYRMWAGRLPFEGGSFLAVVTQQITAAPAPPSVHAPLPARLEALILRCLEKDPAARPQSARALGAELGEILEAALPGETLPPAAAPLPNPLPADGERGSDLPADGPRRSDLPLPVRRERVGGRVRGAAAAVAIVAAIVGAGAIVATRVTRPPARGGTDVASAPSVPPPIVRPAVPVVAPVFDAPPARPAPRARQRRSDVAPAVERAPSRLEEGGYLKENPFR
jgi:serine/threonine-protein kinase